jgi:hypothetical protein
MRSDASFGCFKNQVVDLSGFEEGSVIGQRDYPMTQHHRRMIEGGFPAVKTLSILLHSRLIFASLRQKWKI